MNVLLMFGHSSTIGQEQIIEHSLKIMADIFYGHNNGKCDYFMKKKKYYWNITVFPTIVCILDFARTASDKVMIALWDSIDEEHYDFDKIKDEYHVLVALRHHMISNVRIE